VGSSGFVTRSPSTRWWRAARPSAGGCAAHEALLRLLPDERVAAAEHRQRRQAVERGRQPAEPGPPPLGLGAEQHRQPVALPLEPLAARGELAVEAEGLEPLAQAPLVGPGALDAPQHACLGAARELVGALREHPQPAPLGGEHAVRGRRLDPRPHPREP
jgi:hypothetical protein